MSPNVWQAIQSFNQNREAERLALKYQAMADNSFSFFRGTAHWFYQHWPQQSQLNHAPLAWICGDLHIENFGSYRGDNRLRYFDVNDFDEALLAPCSWDLARFLCSLLLAAQQLQLEQDQALKLCKSFLHSYCTELQLGKARWIERATATGMIGDLLDNLKQRSAAEFIAERTIKQAGKHRLKIDGHKTLPATAAQQQLVRELIAQFASSQPQPEWFQVLDVARRIAGLSSLGLPRYVVLVAGKAKRNPLLLDLKYQPSSALTPYVNVTQPHWANPAQRVVSLQNRGQAIAPAFLSAINHPSGSYVLKQLIPSQDRLKLTDSHGKPQRLQKMVHNMAQLAAWSHIRAAGWQGSANAEQLQTYGLREDWQAELLNLALIYSQQVNSNWEEFRLAVGDWTHF